MVGTAVPDPHSSWERVQRDRLRDRRRRRLWTAGLTALAALVVGLAAYTIHRSLISSPAGPAGHTPPSTAPRGGASSSRPVPICRPNTP